MVLTHSIYIPRIKVLITRKIFFFLNLKLNLNALSHTHSHYLIFNIKPILLITLSVYFRISLALIWKTVESPPLCVYYKYISLFSLWFYSPEIDVSRWLNVMKQIKQMQPVLNMENSGHWAYLKSLKVKHQNGFEGYLILTGARSQLTTLIKPQYIALHMSGNPRFQYYSKPEWYFLRCWRNVTYLFSPFFTIHQSRLLFLCTWKWQSQFPAQLHIIWLCDTNMRFFFP